MKNFFFINIFNIFYNFFRQIALLINIFLFNVEFLLYIIVLRVVDFTTINFNFINGLKYIRRIFFPNDTLNSGFFLNKNFRKNLLNNNILLININYLKYSINDILCYMVVTLGVWLKSIFYKNIFFKDNFNKFYFLRNILRLQQTKLGFYNYNRNLIFYKNIYWLILTYLFVGLKYMWKGIKFWILPFLFLLLIVYFGLITKVLPFNKIIFIWLAFFMVFYWLISGFVFFFKKYQYGKYTSAIQRFWRRSYILFWLLESCLLVVFVYLTFIASQESFYMFDQIQIYKTHLFSWRVFFLKIFPIILLLLLAFFFLLMIKWNVFSKHSIWLLFFTMILTYVIWIEFYQFFHIVNFYGNLNWNYDAEEKLWNLELETRRTRIVNHYIMWLLILKFWHLLFVYVFWIFFILRNLEKNSIKYPLFSANQQNLIILFLMNWLCMFPWIKIYFRKFLDIPYFWFYINNRVFLIRLFFVDIKNFWYAICIWKTTWPNYYFFKKTSFFYWIETNKFLLINQTKQHFIRNQIIELLFTS